MEPHKPQDKSSIRLSSLLKIEQQAQEIWATHKFSIANPNPNQQKYFITFPSPYINGRLLLIHGHSTTKADFIARYKKLKGYNVLWSLGFHGSGSYISNVSKHLQTEFDTIGSSIAALATELEKRHIEEELTNPQHQHPRWRNHQKTKLLQYSTLRSLGVPDEEIKKFTSAYHWLSHFPNQAIKDLSKLGVMCDFRHSFVTTERNPYYDSFVKWQFSHLEEKKKLITGKRACIFSPLYNDSCSDQNRAQGEGINPQEFTLIKLKVLELPQKLKSLEGNDNVYLVAATLRPETLYGQTNCFVRPTARYGAYYMKDGDIFICSERAARNMAYQGLTNERGQLDCLLEMEGVDLLGIPLKAPLTSYETIFSLPMSTLNFEKGTGIAISVPSDVPEDLVNLRELQRNQVLRQRYNLRNEWVLPFEPIPIIQIPGYSTLSAVKACEDLAVRLPNDRDRIAQARELIYYRSFYEGVMTVGEYRSQKVLTVKDLIKKKLLETGDSLVYYEPEGQVISRAGDVCVVSLNEQWALNYGDRDWKDQVLHYIKAGNLHEYHQGVIKNIEEAVEWLDQWGVTTRSGLGTRLPTDSRFVIDSLSDSTIEMAYLTIAHLLQGNVEGSVTGALGIQPEDLTRETWDFIFLDIPYKEECQIPKEKLDVIKHEFRYWYPLDLRIAGKDLLRNHLTMSLFNHAAIWKDQKLWPKSFYCHGLLLIDNIKMSRAASNYTTLDDALKKYGADATRIALADAGDAFDDANFARDVADSAILKLSNLEAWIKTTLENLNNLRENSTNEHLDFIDRAFENEMDRNVLLVEKSFENMKFRNVLRYGFFEFISLKDDYVVGCGEELMKKDLVLKYIELQLVLIYPICPHFAEVLYHKILLSLLPESKPKYISQCTWPSIETGKIDYNVLRTKLYLKNFMKEMRFSLDRAVGKSKVFPKKCTIIIASQYSDWQKKILEALSVGSDDWKKSFKGLDKERMKKSLAFGAYILVEMKEQGKDVLGLELPFVEKDLLNKKIESLKKEFKFEEIHIIEASDAIESSDKTVSAKANLCLPGKPQIIFG